jgi:spermidine synthase
MALPWTIIATVDTAEGPLQLRQRGAKDFLITIGSQVLMNSLAHRSELALGELACRQLRGAQHPRVLVGGLGMAFTLRAVLDQLPPAASVVVAELTAAVVDWCRGPLAGLTAGAASDPRVRIELGDVAEALRQAGSGEFDAIVFDLYRGPHAKTDPQADPLYGSRAIAQAWRALKPGGVFAIWGENYDAGFVRRLEAAGFVVDCRRPGRGGLRHAVFRAERPARR